MGAKAIRVDGPRNKPLDILKRDLLAVRDRNEKLWEHEGKESSSIYEIYFPRKEDLSNFYVLFQLRGSTAKSLTQKKYVVFNIQIVLEGETTFPTVPPKVNIVTRFYHPNMLENKGQGIHHDLTLGKESVVDCKVCHKTFNEGYKISTRLLPILADIDSMIFSPNFHDLLNNEITEIERLDDSVYFSKLSGYMKDYCPTDSDIKKDSNGCHLNDKIGDNFVIDLSIK